jgi:hypothetical protein
VPFGFILFPLFFLAVGGLFVWRHFYSQRRGGPIARLAAHYGLEYWPEDPFQEGPSVADLMGFGGHTVHHVVRGRYRGYHLQAFERRSGQSRLVADPSESEQVVSVALPAPRPRLQVGPETGFTRSFENDLKFENQEFNDVFRVWSASPRFAHDVIHPRMMEWMLADPRAYRYEWRLDGAWIAITWTGFLDPAELIPAADYLIDVLDRIPRHVWSEK